MKLRRSAIDDVRVSEEANSGPPILFTNQDIRKMFMLANLGEHDVFYDLGSGWGQNLVIALTEFGVRKAVGIELDSERISISENRLRRLMRNYRPYDRWMLYEGGLDDLFADDFTSDGIDLSEATVVFYGLNPSLDVLRGLERKLKDGTRLLTYYLCLFPEIMPVKRDYPFFLSVKPFRVTKSALEWLSFIIDKPSSSIRRGAIPDENELWDELGHDYDVDSESPSTKDLRRRLANLGNTRRSWSPVDSRTSSP